jgi:transcriptional regulator with XRE-family HTH domain
MSTQSLDQLHPASAPRLHRRALASRWAALPVVLIGTFMVVLDFFIVNVSLPSIRSGLHASDGAIEWVAAGYGLTSAVFLITSGRLGDRYGRRRMFALGLALFTLSSAFCGAASSSQMLVLSRLAQGGAAALLMPQVLSIIGVLYDGVDRARALAAYGMAMGLAAVSGQLIGGLLLQAGVSTRHLSFVETGRSRPSPEMVLTLADQLEVPLRERNQLLLAAGYAPRYRARSLDDPDLAHVRDALGRVLAGHEPYPAIAVDRCWNLVMSNSALDPLLEDVAPELLPMRRLVPSPHPVSGGGPPGRGRGLTSRRHCG